VLGILPDAEVVVVIAAYRALASLYHPDKWKGDVSEATRRMAEINVAYGVLGDIAKRKEYDASRKSGHSSFEAEDVQRDEAFDSALSELEDRWHIAVEIFPDLWEIRRRLAKTAHRLAFAFVTVMLETKRFNLRHQVAEAMENSFLEQYFGTDKEIASFVKKLVLAGRRDAIKAVNRYVDVLGSNIPANLIIGKVQQEFGLYTDVLLALGVFWNASNDPNSKDAFEAAWTLAIRLGFSPKVNGAAYQLLKNHELLQEFSTKAEFVLWMKHHHC
jgi:hypothetical protein